MNKCIRCGNEYTVLGKCPPCNIEGTYVYGVFSENGFIKMYSEDLKSLEHEFGKDIFKNYDVRILSIDEFRKEIIKAAEDHG